MVWIAYIFFSNAHDSLRLNTVLYTWPWGQNDADSALCVAENETLQVILAHAPPPQGTSPDRRLSWYCDLWHWLWESEESTIFFDHDVGNLTYDDAGGKMGSDLETRNYIWIPRSSRGMKGAKHPTC